MAIQIRRATPADEQVLTAFNAALAWESEHKRLDNTILQAGVRAVLADPAKGFYTVAEEDGEIIGQLMVTTEWSDWRNGWFWWVQSVYVRAEGRRRGVFRALYEAARDQAAADPNVIGLRLYVEQDNVRAQQTYLSMGMAETAYRVMEVYPL